MNQQNSNTKKLKVVVISGGGVYGIIPCNFLRSLCQNNLNKVDVLGGTSVGGILALHLSAFCNTIKLYDDFKNNVNNFFVRKFNNLLNPFSSKYDSERLEQSLKKILPSKVSDCQKHFVVPSFSLKSVSPIIFHNFDKSYDHMKIWKIARSTSAAPMFYPPFSENILIDGGILENVPIITTASMICKYLNKKPSDLDMFVIGTGVTDKNLNRTKQEVDGYTKLDWAKNLLPILITNGNEMMSQLWGENMGFNYFKMFNPVIINGIMDNINEINQIEEKCEIYRGQFVQAWNDFINY